VEGWAIDNKPIPYKPVHQPFRVASLRRKKLSGVANLCTIHPASSERSRWMNQPHGDRDREKPNPSVPLPDFGAAAATFARMIV